MQQVRLEPFRQRLKRLALGWFSNRFVKRQRVYRVTVGGATLKRIVFASAERPAALAPALARFRDTGSFPRLRARYDNELWVEFVEGRPVARDEPGLIADFAELLGSLYRTDARQVAASEHPLAADIEDDLAFLAEAGVIGDDVAARCTDWLRRSMPDRIWTGYDYGDPLLKNLLRSDDGRLRFIDVESIRVAQPIGMGAAKACERWIGDAREEFLDRLEANGAAPFRPYFAVIELAFLAAWTKRSTLQGKGKLVTPERFARFTARANADAA